MRTHTEGEVRIVKRGEGSLHTRVVFFLLDVKSCQKHERITRLEGEVKEE